MKLGSSYHLLTKDERLRLYLRAVSRDDQHVIQQIIAASPRLDFSVIDFSPDCHILYLTSWMHSAHQADLALACYRLFKLGTSDSDDSNDYALLLARVYATHYVLREKAWKQINTDHGVNNEKISLALQRLFPFSNEPSSVDSIEKLALSADEYSKLYELLIDTETPLPRIPTLEEIRKDYLEIRRDFSF